MREGRWIFHRLGPGFVDEMLRRAQDASSAQERARLAALPSYRLSALALEAVDRDLAFAGEDGPSTVLDLGAEHLDGSQSQAFWRALLHSFNTNGYYPDAPPVEYCRPTADHHRALEAALAVLEARAPHTHAAITAWIPRILLVRGALLSGSSPRFFGCILMPADLFSLPPGQFASELVHEMAHQEFFVLNAYDRLVGAEGDDVWRFSAFAGIPRPTIGRLHAAHALFRIIQLCRQTGERAFIHRGKLWRTVRTFRPRELTPLGRALVDEVYRKP